MSHERYLELKKKGWKNLGAEEREEYQALKPDGDLPDDLDTQTETVKTNQRPDTDAQGQASDVVEVKKGVLESLMARIENLEQSNKAYERKAGLYPTGEWKEAEDQERVYKATLRKWRESTDQSYMYVVGLQWLKDQWEPNKQEMIKLYTVTFRKEDNTEESKNMNLVDFIKTSEREEVTILERKVKKLVSVSGYVRQRKVKPDGDGWEIEHGGRVPLQVTREEATVTVKLPDGRVWDLPEKRLNE